MRVLSLIEVTASLTAIGIIIFFGLMDDYYWNYKSSKTSPNKHFIIVEYHYLADKDRHAPYGTYLYLQQGTERKFFNKGDIIFAGYCNNAIDYRWKNDAEISLRCAIEKESQVHTLSKKVYGIDVSFIFHSQG